MRVLDVLGGVIVAIAFGIGAAALVKTYLRGLSARKEREGKTDETK